MNPLENAAAPYLEVQGLVKTFGNDPAVDKISFRVPPGAASWPHMTVAQNVAYPLEMREVDRAEIDERVNAVLRLVGLGDMADKLATQPSGGRPQRAGTLRA